MASRLRTTDAKLPTEAGVFSVLSSKRSSLWLLFLFFVMHCHETSIGVER